MDAERFSSLVSQLYAVVDELEQITGRPFTPDGHMVGSLGETLASHHYGLSLEKPSNTGYDATHEKRKIEIKATQGSQVAFRCEPEFLIVLRLEKDGTFEEIYNGPGGRVWALVAHKPLPKNGQYQVSLTALRRLAKLVALDERIQRVR
jgi:hypothetical protein